MQSTDIFGLWPHQEKAYSEIMNAWRDGYNSVIAQLPTGAGKTRVIRQIVDTHSQSRKVIYIVAHRGRLIKQMSDDLTAGGIKHGIIQAGFPHLRYRVQVCSIGTLINRLDKLTEPEFLIIDECHHAKAESFLKIFRRWPAAKILGVTATPRRPDGKPMNDIFQKLIIGPGTHELIEQNYLSQFEYFAPSDVDDSGMHKRMGEYIAAEVADKVDTPKIIGEAVEKYRQYADGLPAIVCCVNIHHAEHVAERYQQAGYKAVAVHSKLPSDIINAAIHGLQSGSVQVLVQVDLLGEGVDIKGAVVLQMLRMTASEVIFLQQAGRVLRIAPGKTRAIILDHVGNWKRHGLPDDPRQWSLEAQEKTQQVSQYRRCPECFRPIGIREQKCPYCGAIFKAEKSMANPELPTEGDGELVDVRALQRSYKDLSHAEKSAVILRIRYEAARYGQAVKIVAEYRGKPGAAWYIWTKVLSRDLNKKYDVPGEIPELDLAV
jgi:DNA repair protein RadD